MSQNATSVELTVTVLSTNPGIYPLSSPVSRALIISELLRTIFLFCVAEDGEEPRYTDPRPWSLNLSKRSRRRYPLMSGKEAPLLLAHICRSWRRTALDTPQLWACLHLHIPEYMCRKPWLSSIVGSCPLIERRLSALKFWLKKSRDCPISVYFTVGWRVEYGSRAWSSREDNSRILSKYPVAARFSQELLKHAHRWENVFLCLPKADLLPFYDNFQQNLPLLKHFEIDKPHTKMETAPSRDLSIYSTPKLKGLALSGITSDYVLVPDGLPHTLQAVQLTYMTLRFTQNENGHRLRELVLFHITINETDFARFPTVFPLLEQLTLMNCLCRRAEQGEVIDAVVLDKLCSLRLRSPYIFNCHPLPWMVAPTLRHLDLTIEGRGGLTQGADVQILNRDHEIVRFLRRSRAPIKSFCYRSTYTQKSDVIEEMLIAMPSLVKLRCEGFLLPLATLKALSHSVCPCLKSIHNECPLPACDRLISRYRPNAEDFAELIGARCRSRRDIELGRIGKIGGSSFISELAFPVHEAHEILLRASREFKEAEARWTNTHICGDTCPDFDLKKW